MDATICLRNPSDDYIDEVLVKNIENKNCFSYVDNNNDACEMIVFEDGICFFKQSEDHLLELNLRGNNYAKITTEEGNLKFDVKVVDFKSNNDILVMHYIVNDEARIIEIKYL